MIDKLIFYDLFTLRVFFDQKNSIQNVKKDRKWDKN